MMEEEKEPLLKKHVQEGLDPNLSYTKERKSGKENYECFTQAIFAVINALHKLCLQVLFKQAFLTVRNASEEFKFRYATCWDIFLMIFGSLMAIVHGTGFPLLSLVFGDVTNTFISGPGGANRNVSPNMSLPNMTIADFNEKMTQSALKKFFHAIMRQEISWFDERQSGELTTRLADDLEKVKDGMGDKFSFVIQFASAFFSGFGVGFWKGWKMTLVMMSLSPLLAICASLMGKIKSLIVKPVINGYEKALLESRSLGIKKGNFNGFFIGLTYLVMFGTYALAFW
ncbi:hypothetical protein KUTeg_002033 [Tegillarca granosa]|uniref:ABC transmembrane type-1 domain-containing protein n=1 Tax=Tegillarca granosa TaxID=220873 RepID=A0ABQ9FUL2_TEGGR|nr:hypothetical protein KUTeg_002033 [Tegillarca granosa]